MTYPLCVDCKYHHEETIVGPQAQLGRVALCYSPEFRHPVNGKPLSCLDVRQSERLCDLTGKGFVAPKLDEKSREPITLEIVKD